MLESWVIYDRDLIMATNHAFEQQDTLSSLRLLSQTILPSDDDYFFNVTISTKEKFDSILRSREREREGEDSFMPFEGKT